MHLPANLFDLRTRTFKLVVMVEIVSRRGVTGITTLDAAGVSFYYNSMCEICADYH
jgi:hypothetical protein